MAETKSAQPASYLRLRPLLNPLGQVVRWPAGPGEKSLVVEYLARKFQTNQRYSEVQVGEILCNWHTFQNPALLRRELVERGFLTREANGSSYMRTALGVSDIPHRLKLENIQQAAQVIDPVFRNTPQFPAESLSEMLGLELVVKVETLNPIRSFKGRGADYFISKVVERGDTRQLVCASAGNFGQAMAYACRKHGLPLVVYASVNANPLKVERMRALGAEVRLVGEDFDAAKLEAKRYCQETGAWMVEDGKEPEISEGAGSIAVELLQYQGPLEAVVVPLGNGALLGGVARWVKALTPEVRVVGVGAAGAPAMAESWRSGTLVQHPRIYTIADGIGVRVPIPEALQDMEGLVDEVLLVTDAALLEAMRRAHTHLGLVLEPSGAAGLAAIQENPNLFAGKRVATVLCGSNLTEEQMKAWL
jgi:threonine dehydratase